MPNLSIKNVPEALAEQLRQRAAANHRSLQGELMAILEATIQPRHPASTLTLHNATVSSETVQQRLQAIAQSSNPMVLASERLNREECHARPSQKEGI